MKYYALTGPFYTIDTCWGLVRQADDKLIERFDKSRGVWVEDVEMLQVYTGDIECDPVTKKKAIEIISKWGFRND